MTLLAGRLLYDPEKKADEQHRTVWCHRALKNGGSQKARIFRRRDGSGARLTGVVTCGAVWTCPTCCARVAEQRKEELGRAIVFHNSTGGHVYLMTLTAPHGRELALKEFRRLLAKALQKFKNGAAYKGVHARYEHAGSVRSLEVTWGEAHGWHLHTHDLYFARPGLETDQRAIDELKSAWIDALIKVGLGSKDKIEWMWEHGLDIRGGQAAADYVTKFGRDAQWGLSAEITRGHAKIGLREFTGIKGNVTPFALIPWAGEGDELSVRLFREYADAMKGARMLYWSPHLKAKLGVNDCTDEEVAADEAERPEEKMVAEISGEDLALVHSRGALGELLQFVCLVAEDNVADCVRDFLDALRSRPPTGRGFVRIKLWKMKGFTEPMRLDNNGELTLA